jgi:DNA polymerase-3 subunit chi
VTVQIGFYHCTSRRPRDVLPALVTKALEAGHRVAIHSSDGAELDSLDSWLWTFDPASFLPHGRDNEADQPVLLTPHFEPANKADVLIAVGGQLPGHPEAFARVLYLFDGTNEDDVATARAHWRALSAREDTTPVYWTQGERGGWSKKA